MRCLAQPAWLWNSFPEVQSSQMTKGDLCDASVGCFFCVGTVFSSDSSLLWLIPLPRHPLLPRILCTKMSGKSNLLHWVSSFLLGTSYQVKWGRLTPESVICISDVPDRRYTRPTSKDSKIQWKILHRTVVEILLKLTWEFAGEIKVCKAKDCFVLFKASGREKWIENCNELSLPRAPIPTKHFCI